MDKKIRLIGTILGVVLFICLVAGFTYAYLQTRDKKTLTTSSGKLSIDYVIEENIDATNLSPSTSKDGGIKGQVKAKLSSGSVPGIFNLYITPTSEIAGLNTALKYEVYVGNRQIGVGNFETAEEGTPLKIASQKLNSSSTYTSFKIYIWLDNSLVTADAIGKTFSASISADSTNITGEFDNTM